MTTRRDYLTGSLALLAAATALPASAQAKRLSIGFVPSTLFAPLFVAAERGYLRDQGIDANLTPIIAGQDAMALLATGQLDLVAAALSAAFYNAVDRGLDVKFVASTAYQPRTGHPSALMMREDLYLAGAHDARSLRGKKIGWIGGAGAASSYYVARILRPFGMTTKDIEAVNISNPDQGIALERKAVDAVFTSAPFTEAFAQRHLARIIGGPPAGISASGIFVGPNLIKNPDVARATMTALRRAASEIAGRGYYLADNLQAYAKYTKQPVDTLAKADRYDVPADLRIDQPTVEDMQREFLAQGVLAYKSLINEVRLVARY